MKPLSKGQKSYCSKVCRCTAIAEGTSAHRPPEYRAEFGMPGVLKYIKYCEEEDAKFMVTGRTKLPTREGYSIWSGLRFETFVDWELAYQDFRDAMKHLKRVQKQWLTECGLSNRYNPTITKLHLMTNHGMVERKESKNLHALGIVRKIYEQADALDAGEDIDE